MGDSAYMELLPRHDITLSRDGLVNIAALKVIKDALKCGYLIPERNRLRSLLSGIDKSTNSTPRIGMYSRVGLPCSDTGLVSDYKRAHNMFNMNFEFKTFADIDTNSELFIKAYTEKWDRTKIMDNYLIRERTMLILCNSLDSELVYEDGRQLILCRLGSSDFLSETIIFEHMARYINEFSTDTFIGYRMSCGGLLENQDISIFDKLIPDHAQVDDGLSSRVSKLRDGWKAKIACMQNSTLLAADHVPISI